MFSDLLVQKYVIYFLLVQKYVISGDLFGFGC